MNRFIFVSVALCAVACSHPSASTSSASDTTSTSGGEAQSASNQRHASTPVAVGPAILAVPLPGIERGDMPAGLQQLWVAVEEAVAIIAPEPPPNNSDNAIAEWVAGPFTLWIQRRVDETRDAAGIAATLTDLTEAERGFAATLIAFAFEDMAASARGAPVPEWISVDANLLRIYAESIDRALLPVAQYAAVGYDGCVQLFAAANEPAWNEWAPYCGAHLNDLREVFGRYARRDEAPAAP